MPRTRHSRQKAAQSEFSLRLLAALKFVADAATGRQHGGRRHRRSQPHPATHGHRAAGPFWVRKRIGWPSLVVIVCVSFGVAWLGWRIIIETAAQSLAVSAPKTSLRLMPDEAAALNQLAQQQLIESDGDLEAAKSIAERALKAHPLDDRALVILGFIAERNGDRQTANRIAQIAGERSWRNPITQLWLFERGVRDGEFAAALTHADALLRVNAGYEKVLFPMLARFTTSDRSIAPLVAMIAANPPWRGWFLANLSGLLANQSRLDKLFSMLGASASPPTKTELVTYLSRLVKDGNYTKAHQLWLAILPPAESANDTYPYNADFTAPPDGMPFNWQLRSVPGAHVQIVKPEGSNLPALRLEFSGRRIQPIKAEQLMLLAPGYYRLSGRVRAENLQTQRGLWWSISCAGDPPKQLAHTELLSGSVPWSDFGTDFQVPATGCPAQWLQLQLPARIPSETKIEGEVWYRALRIVAVADEARPRP